MCIAKDRCLPFQDSFARRMPTIIQLNPLHGNVCVAGVKVETICSVNNAATSATLTKPPSYLQLRHENSSRVMLLNWRQLVGWNRIFLS